MPEYPTIHPRVFQGDGELNVSIYPSAPRLIAAIDTCTFGGHVKGGVFSPLRFALLIDTATRFARAEMIDERNTLAAFVRKCARHDGPFKIYQGDQREENEALHGVVAEMGSIWLSHRHPSWPNGKAESAIHQVRRRMWEVLVERNQQAACGRFGFAQWQGVLMDAEHRHNHTPRINGAPTPVAVELLEPPFTPSLFVKWRNHKQFNAFPLRAPAGVQWERPYPFAYRMNTPQRVVKHRSLAHINGFAWVSHCDRYE
jgi:hypothetical protein